MEFEAKKSIMLEDGLHTGIIDKIEYREEPYKYTDVFLKDNKTESIVKWSAPSEVSDKTKLGKFLILFTPITFGENQMIDPEKVLLKQKVKFQTITEKTMAGEFVKVVDGSIKPL